MPTPRPACCVSRSAVLKPGSRTSCSASSSVMSWSGRSRPICRALARIAATLRPPPSSATTITTSAPSRCRRTTIEPVSGLPRSRRTSGGSMPCTTALRSMCSNGGSMRSSTWRSSSPLAPSTTSSTCLPASCPAWRTRRVRRWACRWNGTMRVRIRPFWRSATTRPCCCSRFCASRLRLPSRPSMLATSLTDSARARDSCWMVE